MRIQKRFNPCFVLLFWFLFALLTHSAFAQEKQKIRMVFVSLAWNSEIPFRAALSRGYFKQQGLQIEPILIRGGPAAIAALVSGEVDFAAIGGAQAVFRSRARGLDLSIIGCTSSTTNYILLGNKQTRTVEDDRRDRGRHLLRIRRESFPQKVQHQPGQGCHFAGHRRNCVARRSH